MSLTTRFTTFAHEERSGSLPTFNWANPSNAELEDGSTSSYIGNYTTSFGPDPTDYIVCTDISTKIPAGVTVLGITVRIKKTAAIDSPDFTSATDSVVQLVFGSSGSVATVVGANKADTTTAWATTLTNSYYGGSLDSWSWSFSGDPTYLNDSSFGIKIGASIFGENSEKNAGFIGIDYVEITFNFDGTVAPSGLISEQTQSNVNRLAPGGVGIRPSGKNDTSPISNINRLFAQYTLGGNVSNISPANLSITHRLYPLAKIYQQSINPELVGSHRLFAISYIYPLGISSGQVITTSSRLFAQAYIYPNGLSSQEYVSNNRLFAQANVYPNGLLSAQNLISPRLNAIAYIYPGSINSGENISTQNSLFARASIFLNGIISDQTTGNHQLTARANIFHQTIGSQENTSSNHKLFAQAFIYPNSLESKQALGDHGLFARAYIYHQAPTDTFQVGWDSEAHGVYLDPLAYIYVNNHAPGQPGYSPFDAPRFTSNHKVSFDLYIRPSGQVAGEIDSTHLLTNNTVTINPPGTDDKEIISPPGLIKDKNIYPPSVKDNNTDDGLGLHELYWKRKTINFLNSIYSPAYEVGYFDILSLSRDLNMDPKYDISYSSINNNYLFSVDAIKMNFGQNASTDTRFAGEGANPSTFKVNKKELSLSFSMPIRVESWGYVDNTFAALYDYCMQGFKGSPTYYVGRLVSDTPTVAIGPTNYFKIDNISDFLTLDSGSTIYIRTDENTETIEEMTLDYVDKTTKRVYFTSSTANNHTPNISYLWAKPSDSTDREPSFTLFSLREGLISGCMVDKISFTIQPSNTITATIDLKFTEMDREFQKNILANFNTLAANVNKRKPNYLLSGAQFRLYNTTSDAGYFNLGTPIDRKYFHGFQETDIRNFEINEITIEISNNLQPAYTLNAKSSIDKNNIEKNLLPYAYYSTGRSISGNITYSSPIKPWLFAEKLSGPSSINNGGIIFDFGPFKLELPEIIWSTQSSESSMEQVHQKRVNWAVVSKNFDFDPYLKPTGIY